MEELTARTEGRSCAELRALLLMLRSEAVSFDLGQGRSVQVPLPQDLLLDMLELYGQTAVPAQTVPVQQVVGPVISPSYLGNTTPVQKQPEDMDASEYKAHLLNCLNQ